MIERMRASLEDYKVKNLLSSHIHLLQAANEEAVAKTAEVFKEGKKLSISKKSISPIRLVCHPALSALTCFIWQWEVVC